jgi:gamma-glutamylcyclotransferase (GGCT)/AIG2-like uncharacterized protein YtfP
MSEQAKTTASDRRRAYRAGAEVARAAIRRDAPGDAAALEEITADDIVVVAGEYDRAESVFEVLGVPHTLVSPREFGAHRLRPDQLVVVNCPGHLPPRALPALRDFVAGGGMLFTTDWALRHVVEPAFPGMVAFNDRPTRDDVVRIDVADHDDPLVAGVLSDGDDPQWWLEGSSYPIRVESPDVSVLIASRELKERYGEPAVVVRFPFGDGEVVHMISHYYLQRSETRTSRHAAPATAYLMEKASLIGDDAVKRASPLAYGLALADLETSATSARLLANVAARGKRRARVREAATAEERAVFVYGTLMPGHVRHPAIEHFVSRRRMARVQGRLYDTGRGFPAAVFGPGGEVEGWLLTLARGKEARALAVLDRIEGGLFAPVTVTTTDGVTAIAYEWRGDTTGLRPLAGRWEGD